MADTPNPPNNDLRSPSQTKDLLEMIAAFKEKVKLEGDYRDILKETIKDSQKAIKDQLTSAAKIQEIGRSTINVKDVEKQIYDTRIKIVATSVKINDLEDALGGKDGLKVQKALQYNESIAQRQALEDKLIESASVIFLFFSIKFFGKNNMCITNESAYADSILK
jgi:predicted  nucleic acid-binding Zn-ribbon protein